MFPKGIKRKLSDAEEERADESLSGLNVAPSYSLQRQCMLDMSLIKLQLCHMLVEPNLCRSVLIANTVRQIHEEMTLDGSWQVMAEAFGTGTGTGPADRLMATEVLCRPSVQELQEEPETFSVIGYDDCHLEEVVVDETLCPVSPNAASTYISSSMGHCWVEEDVKESTKKEDSDNGDHGPGLGEEAEEEEERSGDDSRTTEQVFGTFEIKTPAHRSDPALEELFSDVDGSYYDLDTMLTGMQGAPKMGPYDLLSSHAPSSISSHSSCRPDLNELDHIMEIIVGS